MKQTVWGKPLQHSNMLSTFNPNAVNLHSHEPEEMKHKHCRLSASLYLSLKFC